MMPSDAGDEAEEMAEDPYKVLGVARDASQEEVRRTYRRLVKEHHPDINPGKAEAEERFKAITAAYEIVGDADKRAAFDRGEIDASGQPRPEPRYYRRYAETGAGDKYHGFEAGDEADLDSFFHTIFRQQQSDGGGGRLRMRGADVRYGLEVEFLEAAKGGPRRVTLPDGQTLDVTIPEGVADGQVLRLKGKGRPGIGGGPPGDAYVEVAVRPDPRFERRGEDVHVELAISLPEAVLGGKVTAPTVDGPVTVTVPKGSNTGSVLRLRGRGIRRAGKAGDAYVRLKVVLPDRPDADLEAAVRAWAKDHPYDPRAGKGG
jgi:DnaJ-class molecular chaperone